METYYRERANGRWEYWTYSDGRRVFVNGAQAELEARKGRAKIVEVC